MRGEREVDLPDAEAHEDHPDHKPAKQPSRDEIFKTHKGLQKILQWESEDCKGGAGRNRRRRRSRA